MRYCTTQRAWELEVDNVKMLLGYWWLDAAARGNIPFLPLVNIVKHDHVKSSHSQTLVKNSDVKEHVLFEDSKLIETNRKTTQVLVPIEEGEIQ